MELGLILPKKVDFTFGMELVRVEKFFLALNFFISRLKELETNEDRLIAFESIGFCQMRLKNYSQALTYYELMGEIDKEKSRYYYCMAELNWSMKQYSNSIPLYKKALEITSQNHLEDIILYRISYCYYISEQFEQAEKYSTMLVKLKPDNSSYLNFLGNIYTARLKFKEAIVTFKKVLEVDPTSILANQNIANAHYLQRNFSKAEYYNKKLLKFPEQKSPVLYNLAQIYLAQEDYKNGWKYFENRFENTLPISMKQALDKMLEHTKMWDGSSLEDKSLLIISEQGYGDSLQFIRFISMIPKNNTKITLLCRPGLEKLFKNVEGIDEIITSEVGSSSSPISLKTTEEYDYCVILMSLPYIFDIDSKYKVPSNKYLSVSAEDKDMWAQKVGTKYKIGLVFAGERSEFFNKWLIDSRRSMKLSNFERVMNIPGTEWYNLTYAKNRPDLQEQIDKYPSLIDYANEFNDFYDTACLISNLDLVIGVDTSTIHLSGGLGIPTIMLNRFDSCWRWGATGEDNTWYPDMKILRQPEFLIWRPCLDKLYDMIITNLIMTKFK